MKKDKFLFLYMIGISILFTSCYGLLDEDVRSQVSDNYLNTATGFNSGVNAGYSYLRYFYGMNEAGASITVFGTDEFTNGFDGANKYFNTYDANLNPRNWLSEQVWGKMYVGINTCNAVVDRAPNVSGIPDNTKNIRVAEARFLRAHFYFILVQLFGPVHLTLEETEGVQTSATRTPLKDIYDAMIADLDFAIKTLPYPASEYGRATKPAAQHLLAKVYLAKATSDAKQSDDYSKAAQLAKSVINDYDFELLTDYHKIFEQGAGERNSEVVFAVQNSKNLITAGRVNDDGNSGGNTIHTYFLMKYDDLIGMQRDLANGRPWARFKPTNWVLETLFDRQHDTRYNGFKRVFYCNKAGTYTIMGRQVALNLGDTAIYVPDRDYTDAEMSTLNYRVYPPRLQTERVYPTLTKFLDPERPDMNEMRGSRDVLIMRLAETYLIAAEALVMSGNTQEAAGYVNTVRRRAAVTGKTEAETQANRVAMEIAPNQLDLDFILDERSRELLGEMMRWFDLARTGKLYERVKKYNPVAAVNIEKYHALRPIPQTQIDRTDSKFEQNPEYK